MATPAPSRSSTESSWIWSLAMLTAEQNDELTQVAAGTPMGELLRRYWYPVAFTRELEEFPVRPARLLGEDFAVFKTPRGRYGILPEGCPHRRASLAYGVVEADGLRCPYHGWLFGADGSCLDQPAEREETNFRDRVRAAAGVAQELGGLVWAYIGPSPAPELPRFDVFVMEGVRDIGWTELPCNFVQIMENAVDPHHTEWLHGRFFQFMARHQGFDAPPSFGKKHVKVGFDAFESGIIKRRVVEGASEEDGDWKIGHPLVHALQRARPGRHRVPGAGAGTRLPDPGLRRARQAPGGLRGGAGHDGLGDPGADHRPDRGAPGTFGHRRDDAAADVQGEYGPRGSRRGPARGVPGLPRPDRPAVREEQVRRGRLVRHRLHRQGLVPVQPAGRRAEEAAHQGAGKPEGRDRVTAVSAGAGVPAGTGVSGGASVPGGAGITAGADVRRGWFPGDAERHRRDAPRYCPACAAPLALAHGGQGLTTEYWTGSDRVFACFCGACDWSGDIVLADRVIGHEAAD